MRGRGRDGYGRAGASAERMRRTIQDRHRRRQRALILRTAPFSAAAAAVLGWVVAAGTGHAGNGLVAGAVAFAFAVGLFATARSPEAARWAKGAHGERLTGRMLEHLPGWTVLHDRAVPRSRANLDHVLIGPGGVFYLDSKHWTRHRVEIRRGRLWYGGDRSAALDTVLWEAGHVTRAAGTPARAIVAFHGQARLRTATLHRPAGAVTVLPAEKLAAWLKATPRVLAPDEVARLSAAADRSLPPHVS